MKNPQTLQQLRKDFRVESVSDERGGWYNDGIWLYLRPGWTYENYVSSVHEFTVKECCEELKCGVSYNPDVYYDVTHGKNDLRKFLPGF